ncbi:hypothetical protein GCM10010309_26970 [Streptomyces violaceochromogenes]|nr:hypothetical protein GCM10010309_26970 [Streptomyces violaceochromogenes]
MPIRALVGLGSGFDPPGMMELSGPGSPLVPGRRLPARWRTRPNIRVVFCRAVVKIYHGRKTDHREEMWHTAQGKADKMLSRGP